MVWTLEPTEAERMQLQVCVSLCVCVCASLTAAVVLHLSVQLGGPDEPSLHHLHLHGLHLLLGAVELCLPDECETSWINPDYG